MKTSQVIALLVSSCTLVWVATRSNLLGTNRPPSPPNPGSWWKPLGTTYSVKLYDGGLIGEWKSAAKPAFSNGGVTSFTDMKTGEEVIVHGVIVISVAK